MHLKQRCKLSLFLFKLLSYPIHFHWKSVLLHLAEGPVQKHTLRRLERKAQDPASFKPTNSKSDGMNSTDHFLRDRYLSITPLMNILSTAFLSCVSAPCVSSFLQRNTLRWTIRRLDTCANMWHSNTSAARSEGQTAQQVFSKSSISSDLEEPKRKQDFAQVWAVSSFGPNREKQLESDFYGKRFIWRLPPPAN